MTNAWPIRPPGTILRQHYLRERLSKRPPGRFVEVGCGTGEMSRVLLEAGWTGVGYDLNPQALTAARALNAPYIAAGRFVLHETDWFMSPESESYDLVFSCLVLEHLDDEQERQYYQRATRVLSDGGCIAFFVPGSPSHWGIEDEIAGHLRRYDREEISRRLGTCGLRPSHLAGLTYPLSNIVLPLSNYLVARHEGAKMSEPLTTRTVMSGCRSVPMKTKFPPLFRIFLNDVTLYPFHLLQKLFRRHSNALILYVEASKD